MTEKGMVCKLVIPACPESFFYVPVTEVLQK